MSVIPLIWVCFAGWVASMDREVFRAPFQTMPKLRVIDRSRDFLAEQSVKPQTDSPTRVKFQHYPPLGDDFMKEYWQSGGDKPRVQPSYASTDFRTVTFETEQIQETVDFIEFKMSELNALMKECIDRHFEFDPMSSLPEVKADCVGNSFQILTLSYQEGMRRVKDVLVELVKLKLPQLAENFSDEIEFFVDLVCTLVDADFKFEETLAVAKRASKYYVSPRLFDRILETAKAEIMAFTAIQERLRGARNDVQKVLEEYGKTEEEGVRRLQQMDTEAARRVHKDAMFRKLSGRPAGQAYGRGGAQPQPFREEVDAYLRSRQGNQLLADLAANKRVH